MDPGCWEQGGVDRVIRMVVAEHHVGHRAGVDAARGQSGEQAGSGRDHARIYDDRDVSVDNQGDRAGDPVTARVLAGVTVLQDVYPRGSGRRDHAAVLRTGSWLSLLVWHEARHYLVGQDGALALWIH
jgi:hypothetical protein